MGDNVNSRASHSGPPDAPVDGVAPSATFKSLAENFQASTAFIISVSAFSGALFSTAVGQIKDPRDISEDSRFDMQTVRVFISLAWLSFAVSLAIIGLSMSFLKILDKDKHAKMDAKLWLSVGIVVWSLLYGLITLAFMFVSLVLVAYVGAVGWVSFGFACLVGVLSVVWLILETRALLGRW